MPVSTELAEFIGVTGEDRRLVEFGNGMPPATSSVVLFDGIARDRQSGAPLILTSVHMKIFTGIPETVVGLEEKRYSTVPPGTPVWRSAANAKESV